MDQLYFTRRINNENVSLPPVVTINCENKMYTFQNRKRVRIIKITPGGAGGAILENYENMLTSPKLNLSEENLFYKSCPK